ncbi:MAG: hypothetical protein V1894_01315 [Chloroflexota bacterium]
MERRNILLISIATALALSLVSMVLPGSWGGFYVTVMHPLTLLVGAALALKVSSIYQKELKKAFIFLSLFLFLYMLGNVFILWQVLYAILGNSVRFLVLLLQWLDYGALATACVYTVKVVQVRRMNRLGWAFLSLTLPLCIYIVIYGIPVMLSDMTFSPILAISSMMIRVFDMAVILMLVPVLFLYLQYLKSKGQESLTFALIMGGLIFSLISTYLFQMFTALPPETIAAEYFQRGSLLDAGYIFGYLIVAIGLYAHWKNDEWGFKMIEKALG